MANFLRHIGKHGDRKVVVVFRELPSEEHMCLVVYSDLLNQNIHDPLMSCVESNQGQNTKNLAEELNRVYTKDGKIILRVLHTEGMLKKVQTNQVVMTPAPGQHIRLNELNTLLDEMEKGEEAIRKLAEIDASRGMQDPKDIARRMRGETTAQTTTPVAGVLDNSTLATNLKSQAEKMEAEAKGLLVESQRLLREAENLLGQNKPRSATKSPTVKKSGRRSPRQKPVETVG